MRIIGSAVFDVCPTCGKVVRLNKCLFGSVHICLSDEDRVLIARSPQLQHQIAQFRDHHRRALEQAR